MRKESTTARTNSVRFLVVALASLLTLGSMLVFTWGASAAPPAPNAPAGGQEFEDVPPGNTFYDYVNNLYRDNIISGYPCGGVGEPCGAGNLPYYRPGNSVTRAQMSKFADLGRRNIADAVGDRLVITNTSQVALVISSTTTDSIDVRNSSGSEAIDTRCTQAGQNCWAIYGNSQTGGRPAYFSGGRGTYLSSNEATEYSLDVEGGQYRGAYITSNENAYYSLFVDAPIADPLGGNFAAFDTSVNIFGNLNVSGSKGGYVVDLMQNSGKDSLEQGDVVTIVGSAEAVLGQIPVVRVQKATGQYDSGVVGVVDQVMYVPSKETREAYARQEQDRREAMQRRSEAEKASEKTGDKSALANITVPAATITDADGNVHVDGNATVAETGAHVNVVTLGSYKGVKVDASFGAIKAGDLLTTSPNAGYAMKVTDKAAAYGAIIGKALGDLESGTGSIPVMVTLK
jgi:hypothetical protein